MFSPTRVSLSQGWGENNKPNPHKIGVLPGEVYLTSHLGAFTRVLLDDGASQVIHFNMIDHCRI